MQLILAADMHDISNSAHGRYAELKYLIDIERKQVPTTFFLFGGGSIGPSALSNLDRGSHIIDILNSVEPDAMGTAKREFSYSVDELSLRSYEAAFPIVSSNLIDKRLNKIPDGLSNMALITRNNVKLGFISISDQRMVKEYLLRNILVQDKITQVKKIAAELKSLGADIIILHYFDRFPEISTLLDSNIINYAFNSSTLIRGSTIEQYFKHENIFFLGKPGNALVATFNIDNNFSLLSLRAVDLTKLPADPKVKNQTNHYLHRLTRLFNENIAYWSDEYTTRREDVRSKENAFANFVVDVMRSAGKTDIAIINGGSIRGDATYAANTQITRRTIASELPFRSTLTVLSVSGKELKDSLEIGLTDLELSKGSFPQVSGMRVKFDSSAPIGERVVSVTINNKALDASKTYSVATTSYLASGGDGYSPLLASTRNNRLVLDRTVLISNLVQQHLKIKGKIDSKIEQRIIDIARKP
jgi:2',3'-cyclic-nucleotide 2'-phosphodiesterase (5'-nucleotidase family)